MMQNSEKLTFSSPITSRIALKVIVRKMSINLRRINNNNAHDCKSSEILKSLKSYLVYLRYLVMYMFSADTRGNYRQQYW